MCGSGCGWFALVAPLIIAPVLIYAQPQSTHFPKQLHDAYTHAKARVQNLPCCFVLNEFVVTF
eukprot:m.24406 g.24406  ORF g.24406 m.24406 type:complete len:63 (-) comp8591_c0_seq2:1560-1748(-)